MVLEEASSSQEPSSSSISSPDVPTSDIDQYAGSNPPYSSTSESSYVKIQRSGADPIFVNLRNMPQPVFPMGMRSASSIATARGVERICDFGQKTLDRPLEQEEADALAFNLCKSTRIATYGPLVGVVLGMVQCWRTRSTFSMPFWKIMKEGGRFTPDKFGALEGARARLMWHSTRAFAYSAAGTVMSSVFFSSYAVSTQAAGIATDTRLKEFREALAAKQRAQSGQLPQTDQSEGAKAGETYEMARQRRSIQQRQQQQQQQQQQRQTAKQGSDDDMSPTGGAFEQDLMQGQNDMGMMDDNQARQYNYNTSPTESSHSADSDYGAYSSTSQSQRPSRSSSSSSSSSQSSTSSQQSSKQSGGSAWDRLRQNAMSGTPSQSSSRSQPVRSSSDQSNSRRSSSSGGESFSFSQGDEDKQLARAEAQKEFDARIEQERHGKDFEERGSGQTRRW